jgi:hypothetical protein
MSPNPSVALPYRRVYSGPMRYRTAVPAFPPARTLKTLSRSVRRTLGSTMLTAAREELPPIAAPEEFLRTVVSDVGGVREPYRLLQLNLSA